MKILSAKTKNSFRNDFYFTNDVLNVLQGVLILIYI